MKLDISHNSLNVYKALANDTRLDILNLVAENDSNITEIAKALNISKAITTRHVQQLIDAGLLIHRIKQKKSGSQKIVSQNVDNIEIVFPSTVYREFKQKKSIIKLGHYLDFSVNPTCGLASKKRLIGNFDDTKSFLAPDRTEASLLWFASGHVSYKIPNNLERHIDPELLEITMEIASEFPNSSNVWPSDIDFYVNDVLVGTWTCPGNFSDVRGFHTPDWWADDSSQYGVLLRILIKNDATTFNGAETSKVTVTDLNLHDSEFISLKIESRKDAQNPGGVTIFGEGFGNHDQDINVNLYYS